MGGDDKYINLCYDCYCQGRVRKKRDIDEED